MNDTGSPPSRGRRWKAARFAWHWRRRLLPHLSGHRRSRFVESSLFAHISVPSFPRKREPGLVALRSPSFDERHWVPAFAGTTMERGAVRVALETQAGGALSGHSHSRFVESSLFAHVAVPSFPRKREPSVVALSSPSFDERHWVPAFAGTTIESGAVRVALGRKRLAWHWVVIGSRGTCFCPCHLTPDPCHQYCTFFSTNRNCTTVSVITIAISTTDCAAEPPRSRPLKPS
jgi:hypothetical protein